jgi:hypothetical protein
MVFEKSPYFEIFKKKFAIPLIQLRNAGADLSTLENTLEKLATEWYTKTGKGKSSGKRQAKHNEILKYRKFLSILDPESLVELQMMKDDTQMMIDDTQMIDEDMQMMDNYNEFKLVATKDIKSLTNLKVEMFENIRSSINHNSVHYRHTDKKLVTLDGPAYFFNHHCKNWNVQRMGANSAPSFSFKTTRFVRVNEELLINYGKKFDFGVKGCWCCHK